MKFGNLSKRALPLAFGALLGSTSTIAAQGNSQLEMVVMGEYGAASAIKNGDYRGAIDALTNPELKTRYAFEQANNLCVAYTLSAQFEQGNLHCETALDIATKDVKLTGGSKRERNRLAIAQSNYGVLEAARGNSQAAAGLFSSALSQRTRLAEAQVNLQYMHSQTDTLAASSH